MLGRGIGRVFQFAALVRDVPDIAIAAVDIGCALRDRHIVLLGVFDGVFARDDVPFAPWRDDRQMRRNGFIRQFETHLVVALAGAAVRKRVAPGLQGHFRLALCEQRPRNGGAEQIFMLVDARRNAPASKDSR